MRNIHHNDDLWTPLHVEHVINAFGLMTQYLSVVVWVSELLVLQLYIKVNLSSMQYGRMSYIDIYAFGRTRTHCFDKMMSYIAWPSWYTHWCNTVSLSGRLVENYTNTAILLSTSKTCLNRHMWDSESFNISCEKSVMIRKRETERSDCL